MTEKDKVYPVETIQVTSAEILAGAFVSIGFRANLAENIYNYVCGAESRGYFKMGLKQFKESGNGRPALIIISFETKAEGGDCRILARMLIDENRTILKDKKKEIELGRLFEARVDKQGKLALSDERKRVLLNLRSVLE